MNQKIPQDLWRQLKRHGFCLLDDVIKNVEDFEALTASWVGRFHNAAIRSHLKFAKGDQYTTQVGKATRLLGHAEAYYRPCLPPPDVGFLWCARAPLVSGGETFTIDGKLFYDALPSTLKSKFIKQGVVYESVWSQARWSDEFNISDTQELIALLNQDRSCNYVIKANGDLHLRYRAKAVLCHDEGYYFINGVFAHLPQINHPRYKKNIYTNVITNQVLWGDSLNPLSDSEINLLIDIHDALLQKHRWKNHQLMIINNHRILHGREPVSGNDDRVIYSRFAYWKRPY